jgi:5-deoxy-glucuronate isomerase
MQYHYKPKDLKQRITPPTGGLEFLSCERIELDPSQSVTVETESEEVVLVPISGQAEYDCQGNPGTVRFKDFLYVPWKSKVSLQTNQKAVIMRIGAPSDRDTDFVHLSHSDVAKDPNKHKVFGTAETNTLRDVYMYIDDTFNASRLLVGIGQGSTGGWTVWPPHEHGAEKEEIYIYFDMGKAFGLQCVYESLDDVQEVAVVRDGDMVTVPGGFHPNAGCPGGRISYVYAMAARVAGERDFMTLRIQEEFGDKLE